MGRQLVILLGCIGMALISLLIINFIMFGLEVAETGLGQYWEFRFKHGVFYLNDEPVGLALGSSGAYIFLFVVFIVLLLQSKRKGLLSAY